MKHQFSESPFCLITDELVVFEKPKKPIYQGGLGHFADLRVGGLADEEGVVFLRGVGGDNPMHTMDDFSPCKRFFSS